jgi:hypothetical protein
MLANFQIIIELFTKKLSLSSQKYGFGIRDPGSGKNLFRILDPGVKKATEPGSATLYFINFNDLPSYYYLPYPPPPAFLSCLILQHIFGQVR